MALEKGNEKIRTQEAELTQLQQKMARLSEIVDKQTIEIKDLKSSLRYQMKLCTCSFACLFSALSGYLI